MNKERLGIEHTKGRRNEPQKNIREFVVKPWESIQTMTEINCTQWLLEEVAAEICWWKYYCGDCRTLAEYTEVQCGL